MYNSSILVIPVSPVGHVTRAGAHMLHILWDTNSFIPRDPPGINCCRARARQQPCPHFPMLTRTRQRRPLTRTRQRRPRDQNWDQNRDRDRTQTQTTVRLEQNQERVRAGAFITQLFPQLCTISARSIGRGHIRGVPLQARRAHLHHRIALIFWFVKNHSYQRERGNKEQRSFAVGHQQPTRRNACSESQRR